MEIKYPTWQELKVEGSEHYKKGQDEVEPIDLYKSGGMFRHFALSSIIKYAFRNRELLGEPLRIKDLNKIIHYASLLRAMAVEEQKRVS